MKIKLKPCPFCGGDGELKIKYGFDDRIIGAYVICCKCGASTTIFIARDAAIEAWEQRF